MAAVTVILCFLISFWVWYWIINAKNKRNLPPSVDGGLPILGHTLSLLLTKREKLYEYIFETTLTPMLRRGIEVVSLRIGFITSYVIMNPEDAYSIANATLEKDVTYNLLKPYYGNGLITAPVHIWKKHRKLLNPTFNPVILDGYISQFNISSRQLIRDISVEVGRSSFDQCPYVKHATLQQICTTAMGVCADEADRAARLAYSYDLERFHLTMTDRFLKVYYHSDLVFAFSDLKKRQYDLVQKLRRFTEKVLRKRKDILTARKTHHADPDLPNPSFRPLLDLLLELSEDGSLTEEEIRDEVNTFISAGSGTTSFTLSMILVVLGTYPDVQQTLYDEVQEIFQGSGRDVEKQDLSMLKYTEAVIKETLRLYPVVTLVGRLLDKQLNLKRYSLPAGSRCAVSLYHVGRHGAWGADADRFRPARWLSPAHLPDTHNAFAVFFLGKRNCIGGKYALMSLKTMLVHLVRRYRVTAGDVTNVQLLYDVATVPLSGHHIAIDNRY